MSELIDPTLSWAAFSSRLFASCVCLYDAVLNDLFSAWTYANRHTVFGYDVLALCMTKMADNVMQLQMYLCG